MLLKKKCFVLVGVALVMLAQNALSADSENTQIQAAVDTIRQKYNVPALQVSVSLPGEYTTRDFVSGTTEINGKDPVGTRHLYEIGSNTKAFVSVILLQQEAWGKLSIHDPIDKYIDFSQHPTWPSSWKAITIEQLLNMTSGIYNYTEDANFTAEIRNNPSTNFSAADLVNVAAKHANDFAPGKGWHYSNTGYVLAGMIVEKVIGESIHDYLNANILGSTHFNLLNTYSNTQYSDTVQQQMVHGYGLDNQGNLKDMTSANASWANAAGDMRANTRDLVRWVRVLFGDKVLNKTQMDEMQTVVCPSAGLSCTPGQPTPLSIGGYGLGIVALHDATYGTIWDYTGGTLGYSFNYIYVPSDNIVISVAGNNTNSKDDYAKMLSMQILSIVDQKHNHASVSAGAG